ncbi:MAG: phosphotransferase family protein [Halolamina sp.]
MDPEADVDANAGMSAGPSSGSTASSHADSEASRPASGPIRRAVVDACGVEPRRVRPVDRGNHKRTATVAVDGEAHDGAGLVVQVAPSGADLETESAVAEAVRERTAVPVPRVVATGAVGDRPYVVTERAAGEDLHERFVALPAVDRIAVVRAFGRHLAATHDAFAFDGCGDVVAADGELRVPSPTPWNRWLRERARGARDALPPAFDDLRDRITRAVEAADLAADPPATLFPWDLRPGNALVADGELTAVLDWGEPLSAPPALSVAKAEHVVADWYETPEPLREHFRAGYRAVRALPAVEPIHRLVAVLAPVVDSEGVVTRPDYPEREGEAAVAFHRDHLRTQLRRWAAQNSSDSSAGVDAT